MQLSYKVKKIIFFMLNIYIATLLLLPVDFSIYKNISPSDVVLFFFFLVYIISVFRCGDVKKYITINSKKIFRNNFVKVMLLLFVFMITSTLYAPYKAVSVGEAIRLLTYVFLGLIVYLELNNKSFFRMFITSYFVYTGILCLVGIFQFFTGKGISTTVVIMDEVNRVQATLGNPNGFGAFLVLSFFPALMIFIIEKNRTLKAFYGINLALIFTNIILSFSRNSWLALSIGIVCLALLYSYKFLYILVLGGVGALAFPSFRGRILQFTDVSQNMSRVNIWRIGLKMIREHPFKGVGNGNFSALYDSYVERYPELWMESISAYPSHNSYIKVFSELGIFAFIVFILIISKMLKTVNFLRKNLKGYYKNFYTGFFVSLIVMLTLNLFDNIFFVPQIMVPFWIFVFMGEYIKENIIIFNN
ncbi:O-antigen ligase family protein [Clostridium sp. MSJ-4]|uniref:O-antigen ligase family protein n=1 Tax=Clostridium simiarum TaxID=2841506 RepID=A0ABS6EX60_9CLOT|nr:O-antigen ligase family protein [Clostridium simiarum]MBU5590811.1 O-antigen ligase family protein [Clostridium simiarum]